MERYTALEDMRHLAAWGLQGIASHNYREADSDAERLAVLAWRRPELSALAWGACLELRRLICHATRHGHVL